MRSKRPVARGPRAGASLPASVSGVVERLASGGDGVLSTPFGDVHCAGAFAGERVRLSGLRRKGKRVQASRVEILEASPARRDPPCAHAASCGGCPFMALTPEAQRDARLGLVDQALRHARVAPIHPLEHDPAGASQPLAYRGRARMRFERGVLGYRSAGSATVVPVTRCLVQAAAIAEAAAALSASLAALHAEQALPPLDVHLGTGARGAVVALRCEQPLPAELYAMLEGLVAAEALQGAGVLAGGATRHAHFGDPSEVAARLPPGAGVSPLRVPLGGFSQANPTVNAALVATVVAWADAAQQPTLELYAGSGNLSVALVEAGALLTTVEHDAAAAALAAENLRERGLSATAHHRDVVDAPRARFSRVVLDPPREGALRVLESLVRVQRPERVVYVSCDPRTLARDLAVLVEAGYVLERVRVFDMFPQTPHVESVALLTRAA